MKIIVPEEPTPEMVTAGLVALVTEIERLGGKPNTQPNEAQKYMQLGSLIRCGSEITAAYKAMVAVCAANQQIRTET